MRYFSDAIAIKDAVITATIGGEAQSWQPQTPLQALVFVTFRASGDDVLWMSQRSRVFGATDSVFAVTIGADRSVLDAF